MEWKKILANRKIIGVILILFVSQIILFGESVFQKDRSWFERYNESYEAYLQKEQQTHVDTYNDYIEGIIAQADTLNTLSVFSSTNSFSNDNLEKTKEDYLPLLGLELSYVKGRTIIEFFSFKLGNWFALLCGFIIALEMSEICRNDVRKITFTMRYGKLRLALEKVGAMFLWAVVITLLFQGCVLIEGSIIFQENLFQILDCPAQTFSCFANFPLKVSTWQALALYTVYKAVILYVLMMLVWCVALLCNHMVSLVGICGGVLLVEFFLFTKIDATNVWKLLKFCNIWYQTAENDFFTQYNNLNIFEVAVNRNVIIGFGLFLTYALSLGIGTYIFCNRYPCSTKMGRLQKIVRGIVTKWENLKGKFLEHLSLSGMEMYKVFISQKGIVVIILLGILLGYRADFTQIRKSTQQEYYYRFIDTYLGEPGVASSKEIEQISTKLAQIDEEYSQQMSDSNLSTGTKIELSIWYDSFSEEREFLNIIQEQTDSLEQISRESGVKVWYVNLYSYNYLLQMDDILLNLGLFLAIIWLCIGAYIGEKGSHMLKLIHSCKQENLLYRTKIRNVLLTATVFFLVVMLFQFITASVLYGIEGINAPVQSIIALSDIKIKCTIWQYFAVRYFLKYLFFIILCYSTCKVAEKFVKGKRHGIKN